jgi:hypothetical protein
VQSDLIANNIINRPSDVFRKSFLVKAQSGSYAADLISDAMLEYINRSFLSRLRGNRLPEGLFLEAILTYYAVWRGIMSIFGFDGRDIAMAPKDGNDYRL